MKMIHGYILYGLLIVIFTFVVCFGINTYLTDGLNGDKIDHSNSAYAKIINKSLEQQNLRKDKR